MRREVRREVRRGLGGGEEEVRISWEEVMRR